MSTYRLPYDLTPEQIARDITQCTLRFQAHNGFEVKKVKVTVLRGRYIATGKLHNTLVRDVFQNHEPFLRLLDHNASDESSEVSSSDAESIESIGVCTSVDCHSRGPKGHLCTEVDCKDSGNIFA